MLAETEQQGAIQTLDVRKDVLVNAPIEIVFENVLKPHGPMADMNVKIEAWPGGRWYRDLGNNTGHFWGHVQVIKPPTLLELVGPMFMSYPVASHVQYRLAAEGKSTRLSVIHRAIGLITPEHLSGVNQGWQQILNEVRAAAEK